MAPLDPIFDLLSSCIRFRVSLGQQQILQLVDESFLGVHDLGLFDKDRVSDVEEIVLGLQVLVLLSQLPAALNLFVNGHLHLRSLELRQTTTARFLALVVATVGFVALELVDLVLKLVILARQFLVLLLLLGELSLDLIDVVLVLLLFQLRLL